MGPTEGPACSRLFSRVRPPGCPGSRVAQPVGGRNCYWQLDAVLFCSCIKSNNSLSKTIHGYFLNMRRSWPPTFILNTKENIR